MNERRVITSRDVFPDSIVLHMTRIASDVRAAMLEIGEMWRREQAYRAWLAR
jgi:hypothetical protein